MITSFRVRNLRAFRDSKNVNLEPLTIFVGKNSSGKSTLARLFPLLRQSIEEYTKGPILWYGKYVDFGSYLTAITKGAKDETISLTFEMAANDIRYFERSMNRMSYSVERGEDEGSFAVEIELAEQSQRTVIEKVALKAADFELSFSRTKSEKDNFDLFFNGEQLIPIQYSSIEYTGSKMLPLLRPKMKSSSSESVEYFYVDKFMNLSNDSLFKSSLFQNFKRYFHGKTSDENILKPLKNRIFFSKDILHNYLRRAYQGKTTFINHLGESKDEIVESALRLVSYANINIYLDSLNRAFTQEFTSCRYLAPVRANAERYYRFQDLKVDELDHTGSNLVMLLSSMPNSKQKRLSSWLSDNFEFDLKIVQQSSHYALEIKPKGLSNFFNINDMGFGFSQVLPILVSIWEKVNSLASDERLYRRRFMKPIVTTYVIEQPELHLHPELQSMLTKVIAKIAGAPEYRTRFIIETHSKTFLDCVGSEIRKQHLNASNVSVNIVEQQAGSENSSVRVASFNEKGQLKDWPIGFFSSRL